MILESFIIGSSFLLIIPKSKDSLFLNSILSYVIFWSFIPIVKILDNLFRANNYLVYLLYFCYLIFVLRKFEYTRLITLSISSITYYVLGNFLNFQIRGGDSYLSTMGAISLAFPKEVNFDLSMFSHRPILLSLVESLNLVIKDSLFVYFFQFSSILTIIFIIYVFHALHSNYLLSSLLSLVIMSTPAVFLLSIYYEVHSFFTLQLVTLIYLFINNENFVGNVFVKNLTFSLISLTALLTRFESILFLLPIIYLYERKNKLDLKFKLLISSSSLWYIGLYFLGYDYKSADRVIFLVLGCGILISILASIKVNLKLFLNSGLMLFFLNLILLLFNSEFFKSIIILFNILTGNQAFWGTIGVLFFTLIVYQTLLSSKKEMFLVSILPFWSMSLLTFVGDIGTGWRYGLSSSANRILYIIFFISLLNQILEWKNDKIFTS